MLTSDFPYRRFPFEGFNKAQSPAIAHTTRDVNMVVCFPAATGKTVIAECVFAYHLSEHPDSKCVYVAPYRSLANEKYREWASDEEFSEYGVSIKTGDYGDEKEQFQAARLLVITPECFDFQLSHIDRNPWISLLGAIVVDEVHLLGQPRRGAVIESLLMRLGKIKSLPRIVALTATMNNSGEIASWLKSLNGKETVNIRGQWSPVTITRQFWTYDDSDWRGWQRKINKAVELVKQGGGVKTIVFVQSKKLGSQITQALRKKGHRCAFHNASVSSKDREMIELQFDNPSSGLDTIVSTSTLAMGVNKGERSDIQRNRI